MGKGLITWAILCVSLVQPAAWAFDPGSIDWNGISDDVIFKDKNIKARWQSSKMWRGLLCKGYLGVGAAGNAYLEKIDFVVREDGKMDARGTIRPIYLNLAGFTKSELSACRSVKIAHNLEIDRVDFKGVVEFIDKGDDVPPDVKIKVMSTKINRIWFRAWLPGWLEKRLTSEANAGLRRVWASELGDRLSAALAKEFKKTLPSPE